ncbi:predicted protein [Nematostella vectensis]|uniref:Uncharacterized protein n=1 Tax=Nematostella vectensis TaxID=45351 RepID=A7RPJ1_NEMVE|nr:predicted protein [Nematostella vectensis]|eukprot:XP_001638642.1 predicted protein [Nematostella vectensis]
MVPVAVLLIALAASQAHAECCGGSERDEILQKLAVLDNKLNDLQHMCMSREECPSGWTAYKTSCYKAVSTIMSFDGARARKRPCEQGWVGEALRTRMDVRERPWEQGWMGGRGPKNKEDAGGRGPENKDGWERPWEQGWMGGRGPENKDGWEGKALGTKMDGRERP